MDFELRLRARCLRLLSRRVPRSWFFALVMTSMAEFAPAAYKALAGRAEFVVAGAPACADDLKTQGIDQFVNVKSNVLETLKAFNAKLGIA